jgi:ankyrin repeat protein
VRVLLENGGDPNAVEYNNCNTPLHEAIYNSHLRTVELLLKYGAKLDLEDRRGTSNENDNHFQLLFE